MRAEGRAMPPARSSSELLSLLIPLLHVKRGEGTGREGCLASLPLADSDREEHARPAARSDGGSFAADTKFAKKQERHEAPAAASSDL